MVKDEINQRKIENIKAIDSEIDQRLEEVVMKVDKCAYRKSVDELKKERAERKAQAEKALEQEQEARCLTLREQVMAKFTAAAGSGEAELEAILTGQQPSVDDALSHLKGQRESEEDNLKKKLAERRKKLKNDLKEEKDKFDKELADKDPLIEEELERKKNQALLQAQQQ